MALYQHRFQGHCAAGDLFIYSWWANDTRDIDAAHGAAVDWNALLWAGPGGVFGLGDMVTANVGIDLVITGMIDQATGTQQQRRETPQSLDGVAVGNPLPADVALVVSLRTQLANRRGRGRFYLPQPAVNQVTATGRVVPASVTGLVAALQAAWVGYNQASSRPVVYSRTGRSIQNITSYDVGDLFDTQRRRENALIQVRTADDMP